MNHEEVWSNLEAYLDGALPAEERWAVAAHIADCADCRRQLAHLARMREIVRGHLTAVDTPPGLEDRLRASLATAPDSDARPQVVPRTPPVALRLVAVLALLVAGVWLLTRALVPQAGPPASLRSEMTLAHALFAQDLSKLDVVGGPAVVASWFHDEAGFNVTIPQFPGFSLSGARLIVLDGQAVAQLVYQRDTDRAYLSMMRFKDRGVDLNDTETVDGYTVSQQGATSLITWLRGDDRIVLVGELTGAEIRSLADDLAPRQDALPTFAPLADFGTPHSNSGRPRFDEYVE
jgi:anti-sigma factor RsiW